MRLTNRVAMLSAAALIAGCASYTDRLNEKGTYTLPTSNTNIDVVLHRSDVRLMDCGTLTVIQTYSSVGQLIDSKEARGSALHCTVIPALIDAGSSVGSAYVGRTRMTVSQAQGQAQEQGQASFSENNNFNYNRNSNKNKNSNSNSNSSKSGGHGNNGGGNGDNDGTNPGTDHHHNNGDNS